MDQYVKLWRKMLLFVLFSVLWMFFPTESRADEAGYTIQDYYLETTLRENNVYEVKEIITCDFFEPRHGLYRAIPEEFHIGRAATGTGKDKRYVPDITDVDVVEDFYDTLSENGSFVIKIGDEDEEITGPHTYEFTYKYEVPDDRIDAADFLYYSVLGESWQTTIDHFSFRITFDKPIPQESADSLKVFSGPFGTERNELGCEFDVTTTGIQGEVSNIGPGNAITLYTRLPKGYFVGAYKPPVLPCQIFFVLLMAASAVFLVWIVIAMLRRKKPVQTVEFYPPDGLTSAHVGVIMDEKADTVDLVSLIPWMASKGYLSMKEVSEEKRKKKNRAGDTSLQVYKERELDGSEPQCVKDMYHVLFAKRDNANLSHLGRSAGARIDEAASGLRKEFTGEKKLSTGKIAACVMVAVELLLYIGALGFSSAVTWVDTILLGSFSAVFLFLSTNIVLRGIGGMSRSKALRIVRWVKTPVFILAALGLQYLSIDEHVIPVNLLWLCFAVTAVICLLSDLVVLPTAYKLERLGKLLGLREFIRVAEEPRLRMLLDENPEYFYDILPYAMVFGMADKWMDKFVNIEMERPGWYQSDLSVFSLYSFHRMVATQTCSAIQHSVSQARQAAASSSSGGFSGGGGGGGGGGSW